jgi:hypothetical protein
VGASGGGPGPSAGVGCLRGSAVCGGRLFAGVGCLRGSAVCGGVPGSRGPGVPGRVAPPPPGARASKAPLDDRPGSSVANLGLWAIESPFGPVWSPSATKLGVAGRSAPGLDGAGGGIRVGCGSAEARGRHVCRGRLGPYATRRPDNYALDDSVQSSVERSLPWRNQYVFGPRGGPSARLFGGWWRRRPGLTSRAAPARGWTCRRGAGLAGAAGPGAQVAGAAADPSGR